MKLEKKTIYEFVKASEELPEMEKLLHLRDNTVGKMLGKFYDIAEGEMRCSICGTEMYEDYEIHQNYFHTIEWLKPIKDVYVLTEDEMEAAMNSFMDATIRNFGSKNPLTAKQFIESITKQQ